MHQPYHDHPLLPPWQAMDYKARQRSLLCLSTAYGSILTS